MQIADIIAHLESIAPALYQENYDNAGLLTGSPDWTCSGILISLDATEGVLEEAIAKKCNLVITHHPIIFGGLKKITGLDHVQKTIIRAIKQDLAIYAIHTNLDNVAQGVNGKIADLLGLINIQVMAPRAATIEKLFTFVPTSHAAMVLDSLFAVGAGQIGNYSEASFHAQGSGTYKAGPGAHPFLGSVGHRHTENEIKMEVIFPAHRRQQVVQALLRSHPYEEVAYDVVVLANTDPAIGSGLVGDLVDQIEERAFLGLLKAAFRVPVIRHSPLTGRAVKRVGLCGGAGSFLISNALAQKCDFFISADIKYHDFFNAEGRLVVADIGHFESEQFTVELIYEILREKFPTFAVLKSGTETNPVHYYS
jgi:dinuclear metal center YbgI/SA1388 family protein